MNRADRIRVCLFRDIFVGIPLPSGTGTQSASIRGVCNYAADMSEVRDRMARVLYEMCDSDPEGQAEADSDLMALHAWVQKRKAVNWER